MNQSQTAGSASVLARVAELWQYRELVRNWIAAGDLQGLEIDEREPAP